MWVPLKRVHLDSHTTLAWAQALYQLGDTEFTRERYAKGEGEEWGAGKEPFVRARYLADGFACLSKWRACSLALVTPQYVM